MLTRSENVIIIHIKEYINIMKDTNIWIMCTKGLVYRVSHDCQFDITLQVFIRQ